MNYQTLLAGAVVLGLPAAASAAELSYSGEASVNVAATPGGTTETTADVLVELSYGGLFFGGEIETLYKDPADAAEITLTLGYAFDLGNDMELALGYSRIYLDKSGFASHEVGAALSFPITGTIGGTLEVVQDLTAEATDISLGAEFGLGGAFTGEVLAGHDGTDIYGELGVSYGLSENVSAGVLVEVAKGAKPVYNFGITVGFGA